MLQPRGGVERGPDLIRAAGLLQGLHEQGDVTNGCRVRSVEQCTEKKGSAVHGSVVVPSVVQLPCNNSTGEVTPPSQLQAAPFCLLTFYCFGLFFVSHLTSLLKYIVPSKCFGTKLEI